MHGIDRHVDDWHKRFQRLKEMFWTVQNMTSLCQCVGLWSGSQTHNLQAYSIQNEKKVYKPMTVAKSEYMYDVDWLRHVIGELLYERILKERTALHELRSIAVTCWFLLFFFVLFFYFFFSLLRRNMSPRPRTTMGKKKERQSTRNTRRWGRFLVKFMCVTSFVLMLCSVLSTHQFNVWSKFHSAP